MRFISMLTLALALTGAAPAQAQQQQTEFTPHWYVQPQAGMSLTMGEASVGKLLSPAAQLSVGRQFSPLFGVRLGASGWQGRNWQVTPAEEYKWKHVQANLDATLSLTNLFGGYSSTRRWNAYAFLGGGLNIAFKNDDANRLAVGHPIEFSKVWDGTYYSPVVRGGLGVEYALSERVAVGMEANINMLADKWNSKRGTDADWQDHLLVGVRIALGKTTKRAVVDPAVVKAQTVMVDEPTVTEEQPLVKSEVVVDEPAVTEEQPVAVSEVVVEEPAVTETPQELAVGVIEQPTAQPAAETSEGLKIYFGFNSSRISLREAAKLRQLAQYMDSQRECRVTIAGYASPEGDSNYNMMLSGWRAEAVKKCLVSYGADASRITTEAKGEIDLGNARESRSAICITIE